MKEIKQMNLRTKCFSTIFSARLINIVPHAEHLPVSGGGKIYVVLYLCWHLGVSVFFFLFLAFQLLKAQLQLHRVTEQHIHAKQLQVCP